MKVMKYIETSQEIEISLSVEDMRLILEESNITDENLHAIKVDISDAFCYLKAIPVSIVEQMGDGVKKTIYEAFMKHLEKFKPQE